MRIAVYYAGRPRSTAGIADRVAAVLRSEAAHPLFAAARGGKRAARESPCPDMTKAPALGGWLGPFSSLAPS